MADVPNADADCFWHSVQWQTYFAMGWGVGAWKRMVPHWHEMKGCLVGNVVVPCQRREHGRADGNKGDLYIRRRSISETLHAQKD